MKKSIVLLGCATALARSAATAAEADLPIADFESENYGAWKVEGTAFGAKPAPGTLPGQMAVEGFAGKGCVNSFHGGDNATGRLTSPEFRIARPFLRFLIGGGGFEGKTCLNLLIGGKIVRTATGPNTKPGGSERLERQGWDVREFHGQTARLEIVDDAQGSWGHINVDDIAQTETKVPGFLRDATREIALDRPFLHLPVKTGAKSRRAAVLVDGRPVREFDIELSDAPDWFAHVDLTPWKGKKATIRVDVLPDDSKALELARTADGIWHGDDLYREALRGQFHFSPKRGWNNDPNGMVYADGEYHLFFQHNPYGWNWGNMHWGHAVSRDLVHWEELPEALYPPKYGDMAFSGSAVVDKANTSGWKAGANDAIVAAFTSIGRGECIVYSNDRGRTWTEYEGNPVVKHEGRDPRLLWHEASRQWSMAVYNERPSKPKPEREGICFYTSPDLKHWTFRSRIDDLFECPDIFELPVDGEAGSKKWVLTAASSAYFIGQFDGGTFKPETTKLPGHRGKGFYAAQTFSHDPKGRTVQIGWFQTATPGMPFNQSMSVPLELSLKKTPDGPRLAWQPVAELSTLRSETWSQPEGTLKAGAAAIAAKPAAELLEVRLALQPAPHSLTKLTVRGVPIVYDADRQELSVNGHKAPAPLIDGKQALIVLADRIGFEVFASGGLTFIPMPVQPKPDDKAVTLSAEGADVPFTAWQVSPLKSIW